MKMISLSREEQLPRWRERYARRHKEGKARLLDELCEQYGYSRKHAIRLLGDTLPKPTGQAPCGAPSRYAPLREVVVPIWRAAEQLCGKRLVAALPLWLPHYPKHFGSLLPCQRTLRREISAATLDRLLAAHRATARRGLCGTKPGSLLRTQVPIPGAVWDEHRLGFLEADSVAHCGESLAGDFVWSLIYTDIASTWTAGRGVWNKGAAGVLAQTCDVEASMPFALLGFDFDNGGEWLNWHLLRHLQQRSAPVRVTRSRPYHKDDNVYPPEAGKRRTKELDVAAPALGLREAGTGARRTAHQRTVQRSMGTAAQLFSALDETAGQMAGGQPLGAPS